MYKSGNDFNLSTGSTLMQSAMSFSSPVSSATTMVGGGMPFQSTLVSSPEGIDLAGRTLEWHLKNDSMFPQLSEQLKVGNEALAISGLSDVDYPTLELGPNGLPLLRQMGLVNRVPLPPELVEHFAHLQSYCMMGIFPAIQRAWLSIDSDIYVWTYEDGGDPSYFDGLSEPIIAVELVRPKPGIFQPHIQFLLCLATTVEIVLLGVSFSGSTRNYEAMHLLPEPLFAVPTDGAYVVTVKGTQNGRIFMGAKDGCIYEFVYQAEDGFFGRKCRKINHSKSSLSFLVPSFIQSAFAEEDAIVQFAHDSTRNLLYARTEKGAIQSYDLGVDGAAMNRVACISPSQIVQAAANIARTVDRSCFKPLVSIAAVESSESINVHLVAVTSSGVRLYFTALGYRSLHEATPSTRPQTLTLAHVRLPPGYAANAAPQRPNQVHSALYSRGVLLLSAATASDNDVVWSLSNSLFPVVPQLSESQNTLSLDGKTWALSEVTPQSSQTVAVGVSPAPEPPLVVTQHRSPARQFVLLTPQCCHMVTQLRPVDLLRQLLIDASGPDGAGVRAFFQLLREDQACATALILACSTSVQDGQLADWASRAIYLHGGQVRISGMAAAAAPAIVMSPASPFSHPQYLNMTSPTTATPGGAQHHLHASYHSTTFTSPAGGSAGFNPNAISTPQMQQQLGQQQQQQFTPGSLQQQQQHQVDGGDNTFQFSGRHNGLYIYFGRILRPIWHSPLAREVSMGGGPLLLDSVIPAEDLTIILTQLNALKAFVHANVHSQPQQQQQHQQMGDKGRLQDAQLQERKSLLALKQLLDHIVQVLALWKVVTVDHQLHLLGQQPSFPSDLRMSLKTMLIRDLLLQSGASVCAALIDALIRRYLDDAASTDQISEKLRHVCPSLYRDEDALCAKVNEQLMRCASDPSIQQQPQGRQQLLRQTLDACKQIPGRLNLASVCQQLAANQFYSGVVELCCVAADKLDPHRRAILYYNNSNAANGEGDSAGPAAVDAFLARKNCYQQICAVLQQLYAAAACPHPQSASMVPKSPGSSTTTSAAAAAAAASTDDGLNPLEAQRVADETLHLALQCQDELCHVVLFDWLTDCKWEAKLLELQSPYLEAYLKRQTDSAATQAASLAGGSPDQLVARYDLLWKYYEKTGNCLAAARVLSKLADAHSAIIALPRRIEYLSRSIVCARAAETSSLGSCSSAALQGQFLYELEEKMDVARIQSLVLDAVQRLLQQPASGRSRAKTDELTNAVGRLNADLLDVTQLYEQFAEPLGLWECKLAILHCAGHCDSALVANVWLNIINNNSEASESIERKMGDLARTYGSSEKFFPLDLIVRSLESQAIKCQLPTNWAVSILLSAGLPYQRLFSTYNKLYMAKEVSSSQGGGGQLQVTWPVNYLLQVLADLLEHLTDPSSSSTIPSSAERRSLAGQCLEAVEIYLTDLYCTAHPSSAQLTARFRNIQGQLERFSY